MNLTPGCVGQPHRLKLLDENRNYLRAIANTDAGSQVSICPSARTSQVCTSM